jgi:hypothetical protein
MKWSKMPFESGNYFFCKDIKDWDISRIIAVNTHYYSDVEKEFHLSWEWQKKLLGWDTTLITPNKGFWYGPFRVQKPEGVIE